MSEEDYEVEEGWLGGWSDSVRERLGILKSPVVLLSAVVLVLFAVALYGWQYYGGEILADPRFRLSVDQIEISAQPDWIRANVKAEVVRDGSLKDLQLTDRQLLEKVAAAFVVHSWVAEVTGVRKSAARILVDLKYRRPVAMVEVPEGLVPVDAEGVILPTEDFHPDTDGDGEIDKSELAALERRIRPYPRLRIDQPKSYGVEGTAWGDERVHAAARIAGKCRADWPRTGLYTVTVKTTSLPESTTQQIYQLESRSGASVVWGSPIGEELSNEPPANKKLRRLMQYVKQNGALDTARADMKLDLRRENLGIADTASRARTPEERH